VSIDPKYVTLARVVAPFQGGVEEYLLIKNATSEALQLAAMMTRHLREIANVE
jgi:hypothetical protein